MEYTLISSIAFIGNITVVAGIILISSKGKYTINWKDSDKWYINTKIKVNKYLYVTSLILFILCWLGVVLGIILMRLDLISFNLAGLLVTSINATSVAVWIATFIYGLLKIVKICPTR